MTVVTSSERSAVLSRLGLESENSGAFDGAFGSRFVSDARLANGGSSPARARGKRTVVSMATIPPDSTKVHGYTDADVRGMPGFAEVWPGFPSTGQRSRARAGRLRRPHRPPAHARRRRKPWLR